MAMVARSVVMQPSSARRPDLSSAPGGLGGYGPDGPQELDGLRVLDQEAAGARTQRLEDVLVELKGGEDHDADPGQALVLGDRPGGAQPVRPRHPDVHEDHVGAELPAEAY